LHQSRRYWLLEARRPRNSGKEKQDREQFRAQQPSSTGEPASEERESNWNECDRPNDDDRMPDLLAREFEPEEYRGRNNSRKNN